MDIRVPEELQPILRDFTKAVLRDRPDDVLEYSKAYFVSKWEEQRMGARAPANAAPRPPIARAQLLPPRRLLTLATAHAASLSLLVFTRAASYILEPSESEQYNSLPEPLKLATATTFKRFDIDCDGQLTIDELHMMVTETANAFGLDAAPTHVYSARPTC